MKLVIFLNNLNKCNTKCMFETNKVYSYDLNNKIYN